MLREKFYQLPILEKIKNYKTKIWAMEKKVSKLEALIYIFSIILGLSIELYIGFLHPELLKKIGIMLLFITVGSMFFSTKILMFFTKKYKKNFINKYAHELQSIHLELSNIETQKDILETILEKTKYNTLVHSYAKEEIERFIESLRNENYDEAIELLIAIRMKMKNEQKKEESSNMEKEEKNKRLKNNEKFLESLGMSINEKELEINGKQNIKNIL